VAEHQPRLLPTVMVVYYVASAALTHHRVTIRVDWSGAMPMQEQTLVEALMQARSQLDFLWQFFVTVQIAIFALVFIYEEAVDNLNVLARSLAIIGIGIFAWINGNALLGAYNLLDAMHQQFRSDYGQIERFQPAFYKQFVLADYAGREGMLLMTHGLAFSVVMLTLIFPRFIQHNRKPRGV
jgi:hypothetical protein